MWRNKNTQCLGGKSILMAKRDWLTRLAALAAWVEEGPKSVIGPSCLRNLTGLPQAGADLSKRKRMTTQKSRYVHHSLIIDRNYILRVSKVYILPTRNDTVPLPFLFRPFWKRQGIIILRQACHHLDFLWKLKAKILKIKSKKKDFPQETKNIRNFLHIWCTISLLRAHSLF